MDAQVQAVVSDIAVQEAAPCFWPPDDQHQIAFMPLKRTALPQTVVPALPLIGRLSMLGDALRAMQQSDGQFVDQDLATFLLRKSADLLLQIAMELPPGAVTQVLELRAKGLYGDETARRAAAARQAEIAATPISLLCGPLATWTSKSTRLFHSVVAAVPEPTGDQLVRHADTLYPEVLGQLGRLLDHDVTIDNLPAFHVVDVVACGGEANTYAKQFAYFLPEDEGVRDATTKATLVFGNVYATRFFWVSLPLWRALAGGQDARLDGERCTQLLLLWFRGHDLGHFLRLRDGTQRYRPVLNRDITNMLHEAVADVLGYLALTTGPWQRQFDVGLHESAVTFLAESLRYLRRGAAWFPDSAAAFFELSFLSSRGALAVSRDAGHLACDPEALHDGMIELGRQLVDCLLDNNVILGRRLVSEHAPALHHPLMGFAAALTQRFRYLPSVIGYRLSRAA